MIQPESTSTSYDLKAYVLARADLLNLAPKLISQTKNWPAQIFKQQKRRDCIFRKHQCGGEILQAVGIGSWWRIVEQNCQPAAECLRTRAVWCGTCQPPGDNGPQISTKAPSQPSQY